MINIKHFKGFVELANELHFTRAAERLFLTQPALSNLIQQLEEDFNLQLVKRHTRQVELTSAGKEFKVVAEKLVADFEQAVYDIKTYKTMPRGRLDVAALPSVCSSFLPAVLKKFSRDYPDVRLNIVDTHGDDISHALRDKRIDFGISYTQSSVDLEATPLFNDKLVVVCRRDHTLARQSVVQWADLLENKIIAMNKGTTIRTLIDGAALSKNMKLDIVLEPKQMATAYAYVDAELGVAVLPGVAGEVNIQPGLICIPLVAPEIIRGIALLSHKDRLHSPAAVAFKQCVLQHLPFD